MSPPTPTVTSFERPSTRSGISLHTVSVRPSKIRACLVFHHGFGEYGDRNRATFERLAASGIAVYYHDAMGHGTSGGARAVIDLETLVLDLDALAATARQDTGETTPMFIAGHSLGGLVAAFACLKDQARYSGLLLCSPLLDVEWTPMLRVQAVFSSVLAATVPNLRIVPKVVAAHVNKDPEEVKKYEEDPLIYHDNIPVRSGSEMLKGFEAFSRRRGEFTLPIYAHHGDADKITSFAATRAFLDAVSSTDTTFVPVEGGFHEVLLEPERGRLVERMIDWIDGVLEGSGAGAGAGAKPSKM